MYFFLGLLIGVVIGGMFLMYCEKQERKSRTPEQIEAEIWSQLGYR